MFHHAVPNGGFIIYLRQSCVHDHQSISFKILIALIGTYTTNMLHLNFPLGIYNVSDAHTVQTREFRVQRYVASARRILIYTNLDLRGRSPGGIDPVAGERTDPR